ncbi:MAG: hypothetical protein K2I42_07010 [Anaeroplasmataceae bacterium]|nr:hypothetical protein [Anaeroplasmataceae bacterium]
MVENQKICRIVEEFSLYLLEKNAFDLNIKVKKSEEKTSIYFDCSLIDKKYLNELEQIFKHKRQKEFEIYGWELIGQGDADNELVLVSNLINHFMYYIKDERIYFSLVRYEEL